MPHVHLPENSEKMSAFGDDFTAEVDPAAEFLAREQNDLAGIVDDLDIKQEIPSTFVEPKQDDFLMMVPSSDEPAAATDFGDFDFGSQQQNKELEDNFFSAAPSAAPTAAPRVISPSLFSQPAPKEEPEKIRKWREEYQKKLEEKDKEEERKIKELKEQAKRELDEWYNYHEEAMSKTKSVNRAAEKELVADVNGEVNPGQQWEKIAKLCDFNPKASRNSKDIARMRSIILQLKQSPPVKNL
ncbi:hypothetical protein QYM36_011215 [Artemia franciscana]|uniref:Clathrin light chain n=2 Tax=Artemia franciscana TaxID=6661 RepID=A0AA88HRZ2_ARTSF|nr:hypothetical protein QYM36_011215 [Artemia franciscana]